MKRVGLVGTRGMIGSTLLGRMKEEGDTNKFDSVALSGDKAVCIDTLKGMDVILTCKGGGYTKAIYGRLRGEGWKGFWIDASSVLRMEKESCLVLDPVNLPVIEQALLDGVRTYVGANCTVALMLMALAGLFRNNLVEWINSDTYQAASGAGSEGLGELLEQSNYLDWYPGGSYLEQEKKIRTSMFADSFPRKKFQTPLAANIIPWIDDPISTGQTREEWKGMIECNKILNDPKIKVDGTCVRVPTLRCHAQSFTIKLIKDIPLDELIHILENAHGWVRFVPNDQDSTLKWFSTAKIGGTLTIPIGRLRKSLLGGEYLKAFSMGDQLLWGGAEPLRRILNIILEKH